MSITDSTSGAASHDVGKIVSGPDALYSLHSGEITLLRKAINELLTAVEICTKEKNKTDTFEFVIRQLQEANQQLVLATFGAQDMQAIAEAANQRQTEFLSMLAHELRNPLQPIAMANDLLAGLCELHPNIARAYDVNRRQIAHMVRLVNDLLDASRVSSGKITLQLAPALLSEILGNAVETCQSSIDRRRQRLQFSLPDAALMVEGDLVRLTQVFSNLLINASKFTPDHGHIAIAAEYVGNAVAVSVSDDGNGIPAELQPFVFDLFTQGICSPERAEGGLGIGLSLVRTIVKLHGGSATVNSAGSGKGSQFVVTLPLSGAAACAVGMAPSSLAAPCSILLIEDNVDANEMLTLLLREHGHQVSSCFDGPSGLRAGLQQAYDIVICDIGLPGLDGFQVVSAMRAAQILPQPCFIATSGYSELAQPVRINAAGFDHYLVKPISIPTLSSIIAAHVMPRRVCRPAHS